MEIGNDQPPAEGEEVIRARMLAARSFVECPGDDERAAHTIIAGVTWSLERARWFLSVNREPINQLVEQLLTDPGEHS